MCRVAENYHEEKPHEMDDFDEWAAMKEKEWEMERKRQAEKEEETKRLNKNDPLQDPWEVDCVADCITCAREYGGAAYTPCGGIYHGKDGHPVDDTGKKTESNGISPVLVSLLRMMGREEEIEMIKNRRTQDMYRGSRSSKGNGWNRAEFIKAHEGKPYITDAMIKGLQERGITFNRLPEDQWPALQPGQPVQLQTQYGYPPYGQRRF